MLSADEVRALAADLGLARGGRSPARTRSGGSRNAGFRVREPSTSDRVFEPEYVLATMQRRP